MKKKHLTVFAALLMVIMVSVGILFYLIHLYNGVGLSVVCEWDTVYDYNGKLLLAEDGKSALQLRALGKTEFEPLALKEIDLEPFGLKGKFSYYSVAFERDYGLTDVYLYTPDPAYEGFWPVLKEQRLVVSDEDGARYCIHPEEKLCYPMFSDSIDGVDPYGKDVLAFSANGSYAIALNGKKATVYHTDPMDDSLRVVDVKSVSFDSYASVSFGAFVGNTTAYLVTDKGFVALDCVSGTVAPSLLDGDGDYSDPVCRVWAQRLDLKEKDEGRAVWSNLLLGEERRTPVLKEFTSPEIFAVSPEGTYVLLKAEKSGAEEILVSGGKRAFSLNSVLKEGERVERVDFIYENLIYVALTDGNGKNLSRCYKICF